MSSAVLSETATPTAQPRHRLTPQTTLLSQEDLYDVVRFVSARGDTNVLLALQIALEATVALGAIVRKRLIDH